MVNRPKQIGTAGETAVARFLQSAGIPAERKTLAGANDIGDLWSYTSGIVPTPEIVWEVKAGNTAAEASDALIEQWVGEAERECRAARGNYPFLVRKRRHKGAGSINQWWVHTRFSTLGRLARVATDFECLKDHDPIITITVGDLVPIILASRD
jgi:hypothetical protein